MDVERFKKQPLMGILRGVNEAVLEPLLEAAIAAGLATIEITMNTENALSLIRAAVKISRSRLMIGAGTVCNRIALHSALEAGVTFIVSPVFIEDIVGYCNRQEIPVFPGALTPQEIYTAWEGGATMVKVFPAKMFGPSYFKEVKAPLHEVKLLACGGVTPENKEAYFANGADAVAFGGSVFKKEWLDKEDFASITERIKLYV